jgi:hypothetical protein
LKENRLRKQFLDISKIVDTMDSELYQTFLVEHSTNKYIARPEVEQKPLKKRPKTLTEVILILRKVKRSKLWDKPFNKWTYSDFKDLEKLNNKTL